jgi:predicted DNA-binding transcriptional regulator AlpA
MTRDATSALVLSVREVAEALGVSDDLVYEMTRGATSRVCTLDVVA